MLAWRIEAIPKSGCRFATCRRLNGLFTRSLSIDDQLHLAPLRLRGEISERGLKLRIAGDGKERLRGAQIGDRHVFSWRLPKIDEPQLRLFGQTGHLRACFAR